MRRWLPAGMTSCRRMVCRPPKPPRARERRLDCRIRVKYPRARAAHIASPWWPRQPQCQWRMQSISRVMDRVVVARARTSAPRPTSQGLPGGSRRRHRRPPPPGARHVPPRGRWQPRPGKGVPGAGSLCSGRSRRCEVVEHVRDVPGGVPLTIAPCPGGEGGVPEGHEVLVLVVHVPC